VLVRRDLAGRAIGDDLALPVAGTPRLVPAPLGPAAALWLSAPATGVVDDLGQLVLHPHADADVIIPLTGRRAVVATGGRIALPSGHAIELAPGSRVLAGAVLADGKSGVLVIGHTSGRRQLALIGLGNGQVTARCEIAGQVVRIAGRRGVAVVQLEARRFDVIDLRAGRSLGGFELDRDVADLAIDADGRRLALRCGAGVELIMLADQLRAPRAARGTDEPDEPAAPDPAPDLALPVAIADSAEPCAQIAPPPPAPRIATVVPPRRPPPPTIDRHLPLLALRPRARPTPVERADALAQLDRELRGVALRTLAAIAEAWDTRRLGYGNESKHPFELEVAAILGMNRGFATDHVAAAAEHLAEHERAIAADPTWRASGTPVGDLIAELGLGPRAADIVLVVAASALWGEVARLYGILSNDPGRPLVDELLIQQVLGARHSRHDLASELDARAALIRLGVVRVDDHRPRPFAALSLDPVVLDRLRAGPLDLGPAVTTRACDRRLDAIAAPGEAIDRARGELAIAPRGPTRIVVRGRAGAGRRTLLAALAAEAGRELAVIDVEALPRDASEMQAGLARALRRVNLAGAIPCVTGLDRVSFADRTGCEVAADVIAAHPGTVAVIAPPDASVPFPAGHIAIELPALPETTRLEVWTQALAATGVEVADLAGLAARYRIGPGVIHRAVDAVRPRGGAIAPDDAGPALEAFIRQAREADLGRHARRVEHLASWSSVVLPPDVLDSLRELIGRVRHRRTVFEAWGMGRALSTARGLTALFQGQPGTGKTLVAGVIARELGLDLYQVDLSKVMSKWIGETERNLAAIFDAAEDGQVVLLFDEADSLFAKRTEVRSSNDRYANLEVNYLLQRLDAFEGIAILTTNFGGAIDPALKRRMSFRLSFPFPDEDTREQLWRAHLPPELPVAGVLTLDALARKYQLSGGYIRNACLRAAFLAAQEETTLHQHHLDRAVALEFAELGKLSTSGAIG
jgi:hypothetical protein